MESWLKVLIAAACVVVIAAGGLYFYRDRQEAVASEAAAKDRAMRAACRQARASPADHGVLYDRCVEQGYLP